MSEETQGNSPNASTAPSKGLAIALLLLILAQLLQLGLAAHRGYVDRQALQAAIAGQDAAFVEMRTVRAQLNSIAGKTVQLAQQGNANAVQIVEQMQAAGVNFSPSE